MNKPPIIPDRPSKRIDIENTVGLTEQQKKIHEVFILNPELKQIGSQEQYAKYLETIFPESSMREILYHGTNAKDKIFKEGFDKDLRLTDSTCRYYFTDSKEVADKGGVGAHTTFVKDILYAILNNPRNIGVQWGGTNYGVIESDQIHILGSEVDIQKFKEFISKSKS